MNDFLFGVKVGSLLHSARVRLSRVLRKIDYDVSKREHDLVGKIIYKSLVIAKSLLNYNFASPFS